MLNYIWALMILVGVTIGVFTGNLEAISTAAIDSSKEAVTLALGMLGVIALWSGLMKIAESSGLLKVIERKLYPVIHFLFPRIPKGHEAQKYIATNMTANILGLGWAATPAGLKAMESLAELNKDECRRCGINKRRDIHIASTEMCTFLIINISSLQLIPVNIIAYRSQYGSVDPTAIVGPGIVATAVSTAVAVLFCKLMDRKRRV